MVEERRESLDFEDGVVVKVDQRTLWRELGVSGDAALGDRLEVSPDHGHHEAEQGGLERGAHRAAAAVCDAGAGLRRRRDRLHRHAAQRE